MLHLMCGQSRVDLVSGKKTWCENFCLCNWRIRRCCCAPMLNHHLRSTWSFFFFCCLRMKCFLPGAPVEDIWHTTARSGGPGNVTMVTLHTIVANLVRVKFTGASEGVARLKDLSLWIETIVRETIQGGFWVDFWCVENKTLSSQSEAPPASSGPTAQHARFKTTYESDCMNLLETPHSNIYLHQQNRFQ